MRTQISERFNDKSSLLYKDLSLFHVKRLQEVSEKSNLPTDAFEGFEKVYGKYVTAEDLQREYKLFVNSYFMFEKLMKLPESLHENETIISDESDKDNDTDRDEHEIAMGDERNQGSINKVYKLFHQHDLKEVFPAIYIALSIGLTLPVSSSSPKRAFSKLKLIKNRLRSTIGEDRLESLMIVSCEKDIDIDTDAVINILTSYSGVLKC